MASLTVARWSDFKGGHYGTLGPAAAASDQWGGSNMAMTRRGGLAPVSASYSLDVATKGGKVYGMRYAWGLDGLLYYVQDDGGTAYVRRFDPSDPDASSIAVTDVGTVADPTVVPDWAISASSLYLTIYGQTTYVINPTTPSVTALTGGSGNAPAGRTMCVYGERMLVGGISDARFGTYPGRVIYSEAADFTDWPTLNFFDVGPNDHQVRAIVPMSDRAIIVLDDGQMWLLSGVPGVNATLRRYHGFERAAGAITAMLPQHVAVDPTQTKAWVYDHTTRMVSRFNGASMQRIPGFGFPGSTRTMADAIQGSVAIIGGPDEVMVDRVAIPRVGDESVGERYGLLRLNGAWSAVDTADLFGEG